MRNLTAWLTGAIVVLLAGTGVVLYQKYERNSREYAAIKAAEESAHRRYTEALNTIAEIQDSLAAITLADDQVRLLPETDLNLSEPERHQALQTIAKIKASIRRTKEKIGILEANLGRNELKIAGLQRMIAVLKRTLADRQAEVAGLAGRVEALQTTVQLAQDTILAKQQVIAEKERELGTIFYVIGTKKELTESGIVVAKGGVLGLGRTLKLSGNYDASRFNTLDTDAETVVRAPSSKVQVLSPQPTSSYELRVEGNRVELHILDPREFRKIRHLVIMTA